MNGEPIVIERVYQAPIDRVWKALTDVEQMKKWYFQVSDFKPVVGFEFQFSGGTKTETYVHLCRVTQVVEGRKIAYTWRYEGYAGNSEVSFELFPEGSDKTRLVLTHEGIDSFPKETNFARESFMAGWTSITGESLKGFLEQT
jgi:uncharacterized protein YndB with AHSA1/START domain